MDRSVLSKYPRRPWGFGRPGLPRRRKEDDPGYAAAPTAPGYDRRRRRGDRGAFRQELGEEVRGEAGAHLAGSVQSALMDGEGGPAPLPQPNVWEDERAFAQRVFTARLRDYHAAEQELIQRWRTKNPVPTPQSVMAEIQQQMSGRFGQE